MDTIRDEDGSCIYDLCVVAHGVSSLAQANADEGISSGSVVNDFAEIHGDNIVSDHRAVLVDVNNAITAAIKQDAASREIAGDGEDCEEDTSPDLDYSQATVDYVLALCDHTNDGVWHKRNKILFQQVLRDPTNRLVESLRTNYIQTLDSGVAGTTNNVSKLKKNDWGQGGYYDHFWAAFYDPAAKSKTQSCQLFLGYTITHGRSLHLDIALNESRVCEVPSLET